MDPTWTWLRPWADRTDGLPSLLARRDRARATLARRPGDVMASRALKLATADLLARCELGPDSHPASALSREAVLPCAWRHAALRSYLGPELAPALARLRAWDAEVRAGAHAAYVEAQHRHALSAHLAERWAELCTAARASASEQAGWARRAAALRREILERPAPAVAPAPLWPEAWEGLAPDREAQARLWSEIESRYALVRRWNSTTPPGWKIAVSAEPYPTLEEFAGRERPALRGLLDWLERSAQAGWGVLLG